MALMDGAEGDSVLEAERLIEGSQDFGKALSQIPVIVTSLDAGIGDELGVGIQQDAHVLV